MIEYIIFAILLLIGAGCMFKMAQADLRRRIIPDVYLFPFLLIGLVIVTFFPWPISLSDSVIAAAFGYVLGILIAFLFEKMRKTNDIHAPMGLGDIKLLAAGGIWLGMTGLSIAIVISCVLGGAWGLIKKQRYIPFAPFFLLGGILAFLGLCFLI